MAPSSPQKLRIEPLTSARFLAALFVVVYHTLPTINSTNPLVDFLRRTIGMGYISVSFFFMLSGFILALVYLNNDKPIDQRRFFLARVARIYPLYLVAMVIDLPHFWHVQRNIFHATDLRSLWEIFATVFLVQSWFNIRSLNTPGWSLSAEAFFYLVFPVAGVLLWKLRERLVLPVSLVIYAIGIATVMLIATLSGASDQGYQPLPHLFIFFLGILLAKIFVRLTRIPSRSRSLERWAPVMLITSFLTILAIPLIGLDQHEALLQHGLLAPVYALAIVALASGSVAINRLFSVPLLILLGEASYALYLIHYPIHSALRALLERTGWGGFFAYLLGVILLSVASFIYLETPARRWILSKVHVRSKESVITSSLAQ